jgi:two-component system NtrC family sensor kinase
MDRLSMDGTGRKVTPRLRPFHLSRRSNKGHPDPQLLLRSRNTLRALFDSIPASIYIIDQKFTLAAVNMVRSRRAGSPPSQLVGRPCFEALYGRSEYCPQCKVFATLSGGKNTSRMERHWEMEDEPTDWEINTYPIYDDADQIIQAIVLEQDVTEKRRLEATLAQSEKLAAVGQLAAGLAHEINNPLTAIIANAQLLQRELPADEDMQELVDLISRAGARAAQVVRSLLDLARKEEYIFTPVNVNETLNRSLKLLHHEVTLRSIHVVYDPGERLPAVMGSQDQLQGVWINLLTNAVDALEERDGEIRISSRLAGREIRVVITDTGTGIPPEKLPRIFEPFFTTKAPGRGTGLGLSVCHRVIKQHGGDILVASQVGVGTQFTVILPIQ